MSLIYEFFSRRIFWGPFKIICYFLFFLIIIFYPFYPALSTLILFSYIALWSRIPCMVSDWTKDLDMIDFFAVLIAVNLKTPFAGLYAGFFSVFVMMFSRVLGPDEGLWITLTESAAFFFASLFSPFIFSLTGHNLLYTLFIFTAQRYIYDLIIIIIFFRPMIYYTILTMFAGIFIAYTMNKLMVTFLSPFFSTVFDTGLKFNFPLFIFGIILTISVHYFDKYFSGPIGKTEGKKIFNFKFFPIKTKKLNENEGIIADDNHKNYPEFF